VAEPIIETLHAWHDFFVTMATASATLIGAMFVVMSIGSGFLTQDRAPQIRTFYTATLVHLSGVLLASLVTMVPSLDRISFASLLGGGGLVGLVFASAQLPIIRRHRADLVLEDRFWYAGAPIAAYLVMLAASGFLALSMKGSLELLGFGLVLLLLAGIRNAWDMIVFLVTRRRTDS